MHLLLVSADLMLGLEPWLNTSTGCTYPLTSNQDSFVVKKERDFDMEKTVVAKSENPIKSDIKHLSQNIGQFGNFAYGNITVILCSILFAKMCIMYIFDTVQCNFRVPE